MPFTLVYGDSFVSDASSKIIPLPGGADYFKTVNVTAMAAAGTECVAGEWFGSKFGTGASADNDGLRWRKAGTHAILIDTFQTATVSNGFTYVSSVPYVEAQNANAITAITNANPAVVSQTNTYSNGDILQVYGTTGMRQIAGMTFQISSVSGSGYTLTGLQALGFSAAATAGFTRRVSKKLAINPQFLFVTAISQANQAVVRCSVDPTNYYVVGMKVRLSVPYSFGMTQMDGLTGTIQSLSAANYTMTLDIDSSAFTAFAFPADSGTPTNQLFATLAPAGASTTFDPVSLVQTGYNFQYQPFREAQFTPYIQLGGGSNSPAGDTNDIINWFAYKLEN